MFWKKTKERIGVKFVYRINCNILYIPPPQIDYKYNIIYNWLSQTRLSINLSALQCSFHCLSHSIIIFFSWQKQAKWYISNCCFLSIRMHYSRFEPYGFAIHFSVVFWYVEIVAVLLFLLPHVCLNISDMNLQTL